MPKRYLVHWTGPQNLFWVHSKPSASHSARWGIQGGRFCAVLLDEEDRRKFEEDCRREWYLQNKVWTFERWCPEGPWTMFASPDLRHVYGSRCAVELAGSAEVIEVTVSLGGPKYAWIDARQDDPKPSMIWGHQNLFEMCFPNGSAAAEKAGQGVAVRVDVRPKEKAVEGETERSDCRGNSDLEDVTLFS